MDDHQTEGTAELRPATVDGGAENRRADFDARTDSRAFDNPAPRDPPLSVLMEISQRLEKLERENSELRDILNRSRDQGEVPYPGFVQHVSHVMKKHFYHDKPDGFDEKFPVE